MPYAKKIIEQHGGAITFDSRLNEGTTISVTLPAERKDV
jgi:signal transduction histidine kinase